VGDHVVDLAGDALAPETRAATSQRRQGPRRVLFVMSGRMFGWWFGSLIFNYPAYVKALDEFARILRALREPVQVVLKSHPVSDLHELYDKMVAEHGDIFVEHRKEPMSDAEIAAYDAAVVFSAASAFVAELIRALVPIVYFSGALTDFGRSYFKYQGLEVGGDVPETVTKLNYLLAPDGKAARNSCLQEGESFLNRYIDPTCRSFASVLEEVLQPESSDSV